MYIINHQGKLILKNHYFVILRSPTLNIIYIFVFNFLFILEDSEFEQQINTHCLIIPLFIFVYILYCILLALFLYVKEEEKIQSQRDPL